MKKMNRKFLLQFLFQTILISGLYALLYSLKFIQLETNLFLTNLFSVTFIFILSGMILFINLPDEKPIAERFLVMTMVQLLSILSLELAFKYSNQSIKLILHGLILSLIHFLFQTIFLVRIQKS